MLILPQGQRLLLRLELLRLLLGLLPLQGQLLLDLHQLQGLWLGQRQLLLELLPLLLLDLLGQLLPTLSLDQLLHLLLPKQLDLLLLLAVGSRQDRYRFRQGLRFLRWLLGLPLLLLLQLKHQLLELLLLQGLQELLLLGLLQLLLPDPLELLPLLMGLLQLPRDLLLLLERLRLLLGLQRLLLLELQLVSSYACQHRELLQGQGWRVGQRLR